MLDAEPGEAEAGHEFQQASNPPTEVSEPTAARHVSLKSPVFAKRNWMQGYVRGDTA